MKVLEVDSTFEPLYYLSFTQIGLTNQVLELKKNYDKM